MNQNKFHSIKVAIITFGCQANVFNASQLKTLLLSSGFEIVDEQIANVGIVISCAVRKKPEDIALATAQKLASSGKLAILTGCAPHFVKDRISPDSNIILVPITEMYKIPNLIRTYYMKSENLDNSAFLLNTESLTEPKLNIYTPEEFPSAFVAISEGCNNFCSYCAVPFARSRERSVKPDEICKFIEKLASSGYKLITIIGQNVNSYGKDIGYSFLKLLKDIDSIPQNFWCFFTTSHPKDLSLEVVDFVMNSRKIGRWFHLPLQSASNRILSKMNRPYTFEKYLEIVNYIKELDKNNFATITTDLMVGFPTETEDDFTKTLEAVKIIGFDGAYTYYYQERAGTFATRLPQLPIELRKKRLEKLVETVMTLSKQQSKRFLNRSFEVIIEKKAKKGGWQARMFNNKVVVINKSHNLQLDKIAPSDKISVKITDSRGWILLGIVEKE